MDWQPIETAPKDGTWFLGGGRWDTFWKCYTVSYQPIGGWCYLLSIGEDEDGGWYSFSEPPTHWMPLPPPPRSV